ncbi:MAG: hypothetical protein FWD55_05985 [Propionibacteriaceae bacterium]|nr:hypothetical protein [Propionibacteriaceae bacterium]
MTSSSPQILAVCTGNICRSPAIERLLAVRLTPAIRVASAGTAGVVGAPIAPIMTELMEQRGVPTAGFAARRITEDMINEVELILTATVKHRAKIVAMVPNAMKYTFTLMEFAQSLHYLSLSSIAHLHPSLRIQPLADHCRAVRSHMRIPESELDIPDPYGFDESVYHTAFSLIVEATTTVNHVLTVR